MGDDNTLSPQLRPSTNSAQLKSYAWAELQEVVLPFLSRAMFIVCSIFILEKTNVLYLIYIST